MSQKHFSVRRGDWRKWGAEVHADGVNFCLFSRHATRVELLLFQREDSPAPMQVIHLDPKLHHTYLFWHLFVEDLPVGSWYAWRIDGPEDSADCLGIRFDPQKVLLDPWARAVSMELWDREKASQPGDNCAWSMRARVVDDEFDWGDYELHRVRTADAVIYEMHVGGFTRHPSSGVKRPGSFAAIIEKIPYLRALGVTHVELLPVMAFDPQDLPHFAAEQGLENYWGYSTHSFFAPHPDYCQPGSDPRQGFREMVKELHKADIGVILDVVLNHTSEGDQNGPTINFKGMMNEMFYHLDPEHRSRYRDYTGCGNTVNANHPFVTRFLLDTLEFWVREMRVDGFRFDLASALARGEDGNPRYHAPILWGVELSSELAYKPIIAEAWDAAGLYQVGDFPGYRWREWNGRYRDSIRAFVRGDPGLAGEVATRITGSSDLYQRNGRRPKNSINFVTCHDGFTLWDLVSYEKKRNLANGEGNRDGHNDNLSWNCGVEGETDDPAILALRRRQAKNMIAILLLSQGIPMLLMGDEVLRTQQGNNNGYCQNNELSWLDWGLLESNRDMFDFVAGMIALRKRHPSLRQHHFLTGEPHEEDGMPDITWHGTQIDEPPWHDPDNRHLAFTLAGVTPDEAELHVMMNMAKESVRFAVPEIPGKIWNKLVDTDVPDSMYGSLEEVPKVLGSCQVASHAVVVLESTPV